jgi:2-polyprenyl-3-methyl-5-hydroxy-6-metoxy-1,4-benzoquinol methylase
MNSRQQEEALHYFKTHAQEWQKKAQYSDQQKVNIIRQRNQYVLKVLKDRSETRSVLDVGCGTGDLVCEIAEQGITAIGVDYAKEMIDIALMKKKDLQLETAYFKCCSVFDRDFSEQEFDVIAANGFIEYLSLTELSDFFDIVCTILAPRGSFIVSSRNRLFNIFSMSSFTMMEMDGKDLEALMNEAIAIVSNTEIKELLTIKPASLQKTGTKHEITGVDVSTRFQYTPVQLMRMLEERGLKTLELYPIHIHGVHPAFKEKYPEVHASISDLLQNYAEKNLELLPFSSSFMIHVQKL